jgi:Rieske Fe-S protein
MVSATPQNIIEDSSLSIGETFNFTSKSGSPAVLFKSKTGVYAYSAVCTHEGCTVQYNSGSKNLQCGCHGAVFDPESDGNALSGPTNKPLPKIKVAVEGAWIVEV